MSEQVLSCEEFLKDLGAGIKVNTKGRSPHRGPEQTSHVEVDMAESRFKKFVQRVAVEKNITCTVNRQKNKKSTPITCL